MDDRYVVQSNFGSQSWTDVGDFDEEPTARTLYEASREFHTDMRWRLLKVIDESPS